MTIDDVHAYINIDNAKSCLQTLEIPFLIICNYDKYVSWNIKLILIII